MMNRAVRPLLKPRLQWLCAASSTHNDGGFSVCCCCTMYWEDGLPVSGVVDHARLTNIFRLSLLSFAFKYLAGIRSMIDWRHWLLERLAHLWVSNSLLDWSLKYYGTFPFAAGYYLTQYSLDGHLRKLSHSYYSGLHLAASYLRDFFSVY